MPERRLALRWPEPALTTQSVELRPWSVDDAAVLARAWADEDVARWNPVPQQATAAVAARWIAGADERRASGASLDLAILARPGLISPAGGGAVEVAGSEALPSDRVAGGGCSVRTGPAGGGAVEVAGSEALPSDRVAGGGCSVRTGPAGGGAVEIVGEVGLSGFDVERRAALVGYWLLAGARGRGLATAAVQALSVWAHDELGLRLLVAMCHEQNRASQRVAERAGYRFEQTDGQQRQLWTSRRAGSDS